MGVQRSGGAGESTRRAEPRKTFQTTRYVLAESKHRTYLYQRISKPLREPERQSGRRVEQTRCFDVLTPGATCADLWRGNNALWVTGHASRFDLLGTHDGKPQLRFAGAGRANRSLSTMLSTWFVFAARHRRSDGRRAGSRPLRQSLSTMMQAIIHGCQYYLHGAHFRGIHKLACSVPRHGCLSARL